ncbi:hypothetical protein RchiOBHm_Chr7g0197371 [Rosa chinensis]|uniref:Non-specific serine/threonine protein kinase n=1 Tax=Rosa chinensis TaxID=74649 RepID=A0A2P6P6U2_ROSCH|nr:hypothetical protein RchiOBHm_Chr7g0197371 [Rosa chinensis]
MLKVVSDPFGGFSNWNDEDGDIDPYSWFGVEWLDGKNCGLASTLFVSSFI